MALRPRQVLTRRIWAPKPIPVEKRRKSDGPPVLDATAWKRAKELAAVRLQKPRDGIDGRPLEVHLRDPKIEDNECSQSLGRQLAFAGAAAETYLCIVAGVEEDEMQQYLGRS